MGHQVTKSIIVKTSVNEAYAIWADFENFPNFMSNIKSVTKSGNGTTHWAMSGPLGTKLQWDAETTRLEPNKRVAWSSKEHSRLKTSGQVTFTGLPKNETQVTVTLQYVPPAGLAGEVLNSLFGDPEGSLTEDLRKFKAYAEARHRTAAAAA